MPVCVVSGSPTCVQLPLYCLATIEWELLENLVFREEISSEARVLHDFAQLLAIPLRDGYDLMDVSGSKLSPQAAQAKTGRFFRRPASVIKW